MEERMVDLTVAEACRVYGGSCIADKIMLIDNLHLIPTPLKPRRTKCIILGLCLKGRAEYTVGLKKCVVTPGDCILIDEDQVMFNYTTSPDIAGIGYFIAKDFVGEVLKMISNKSDLFFLRRANPVFHLSQQWMENFKTCFSLIKQRIDCEPGHLFLDDIVRTLLMVLGYDLNHEFQTLRQSTGVHKTRADVICEDFIRLVEQHFRSQRAIGWYSQQMCMSAKYLSECVRQSSGHTPTEWINNYVTIEMRLLLKNTQLDIKEIAHGLGFANQSFFGKFFKKHVGMSPSEYRAS